jgi:hypothetical protein
MLFSVGGAFSGTIVFPDGHTQTIFQQSATGSSKRVFAGEYRDDPVSGGLWYMMSDADCAHPANKATSEICQVSPPA